MQRALYPVSQLTMTEMRGAMGSVVDVGSGFKRAPHFLNNYVKDWEANKSEQMKINNTLLKSQRSEVLDNGGRRHSSYTGNAPTTSTKYHGGFPLPRATTMLGAKSNNNATSTSLEREDSLAKEQWKVHTAAGISPSSWRIPRKDKVNPTAVSSYASYQRQQNQTSSSCASVISSNFSGSSYSGLYAKSRMATTRDGLIYMPSLHLSRTNSASSRTGLVGTAGGGVGLVAGSGISGMTAGGAVTGGRFQNSYLQRGIGHIPAVSRRSRDRLKEEDQTIGNDSNAILEPHIFKTSALPPSDGKDGQSTSFFLSSKEVQDAARQDERVRQWRDQQYLRSSGLRPGSIRNNNMDVEEESSNHACYEYNQQRDDHSFPSSASNSCAKPIDGEEKNNEISSTSQLSPEHKHHLTIPSIASRSSGGKRRRRKHHPKHINSPSRSSSSDATRFFPVTSPRRKGASNRDSEKRSHGHRTESGASDISTPISPSVIKSPRPSYIRKETPPISPSSSSTDIHPQSSVSPSILSPPRRQKFLSDDIEVFERSQSMDKSPNHNNIEPNLSFPVGDTTICTAEELSSTEELPELTTPQRKNFKSTCLSVLPRISSAIATTAVEAFTEPQTSTIYDAPALFLPQAVLNWGAPLLSPARPTSTVDINDANPAKNVEGESILGPNDSNEGGFSHESIATWENCLYVRAEGARTGRICLTSTHLIFIYEDEVSDLVLIENELDREMINDFWSIGGGKKLMKKKSSSRCTTPVNIPPDESGEGGGVELIGTMFGGKLVDGENDDVDDDVAKMIDFADMFESAFEEIKPIPLPQDNQNKSAEYQSGSVQEHIKNNLCSSNLGGSCIDDKKHQPSLFRDNSGGISDITDAAVVCQPFNARASSGKRTPSTEKPTDRDQDLAASSTQNMRPPTTLSSCASSDTSSISEESAIERDCQCCASKPLSSCEESYEEMMNKCIIRAIEEEARRRLQELDDDEETAAKMSTAASCSTWEKEQAYLSVLQGNIIGSFDNDASVFATQTNISSFSELDMEIDPSEERRLYISSDDKNSKQFFIGIKWPLSKLSEIYPRRYMMRDVAFEIFAPSPSTNSFCQLSSPPSMSEVNDNVLEENDLVLGPLSNSSIFLVIPDSEGFTTDDCNALSRFGRKRKTKSRRDLVVQKLKENVPLLNFAFWGILHTAQSNTLLGNIPFDAIESKFDGGIRRAWTPTSLFRRRNEKTDPLHLLTRAWRKGHVSNFDYLLRLNSIAGRSMHDLGNYPVMPWVLSNYVSEFVPDLSDICNYRDMSKSMGALYPERLQKFTEKYNELCGTDSAIPPFMYGSHYSNIGGVVLHYLLRLKPFAGLHRQLQGGQFDVPDRLFKSIAQTWEICSQTSATEVKELTPEWYSNPDFLKNKHNFNLGTSVDGVSIDDVILPPWANNDPSKFIEVMRNALESETCSAMLPSWIDLIFGFKQRGPEAEKAHNVFYHLTYYEPDDLAKVEDHNIRTEIELHISDFGHCPSQLFLRPHPQKKTQSI